MGHVSLSETSERGSEMILFSFNFIVLLAIVVYFGHSAINFAIARDVIATICYGVVAILALIAVILMFVR
jgi:hypothetical protein